MMTNKDRDWVLELFASFTRKLDNKYDRSLLEHATLDAIFEVSYAAKEVIEEAETNPSATPSP